MRAVVSGDPLEPLVGVRENLDVVAGGEAIDELVAVLTRHHRHPHAVEAVARALEPLASATS